MSDNRQPTMLDVSTCCGAPYWFRQDDNGHYACTGCGGPWTEPEES